jgi:glycosyltransferase involved in cell wall biosynthesis
MAERTPITVLHLRDSPWVDGPGRTILDTASHLDPERIDYHIGALAPDELSAHTLIEGARARGAKVHRIVDGAGLYAAARQVLALVDELQVQILHSSDIRTNLIANLCSLSRPRVKIVSTTHGWIANTWRRRLLRTVDKILLRRFDAVIAVSHATRSLVPRWWLADERVTVLHNALVLDKYAANSAGTAPRRAPGGERVVVANIGRLSPEKGQALLLRAFATAQRRYPELELHFVGIGPLEQDLKSLAAALGIEERVRFAGFVQDMPALYREFDVVVQSSLTEGLPNVVLEAAFLGVPLIATAVGGTAEVIEHQKSGWLLAPGSVEELEQGLRAFMQSPQRFAAMAAAAQARVRAEFSFATRTERLTTLYEQLIRRA